MLLMLILNDHFVSEMDIRKLFDSDSEAEEFPEGELRVSELRVVPSGVDVPDSSFPSKKEEFLWCTPYIDLEVILVRPAPTSWGTFSRPDQWNGCCHISGNIPEDWIPSMQYVVRTPPKGTWMYPRATFIKVCGVIHRDPKLLLWSGTDVYVILME